MEERLEYFDLKKGFFASFLIESTFMWNRIRDFAKLLIDSLVCIVLFFSLIEKIDRVN
jgi:hypothetical protein